MTTAARLTRLGVVLPAFLLILLAGCSAGWKAPMEHRGDASRYSQQSTARDRPAIRAQTYRVQRGDTLYSIAWRSGQDFRGLARLNGIRSPYTIYPGQLLRLTSPTSSSKPTPKSHTQTSRSTPPKPQVERKSTAHRVAPARAEAQPSDGSLRWQWPASGVVLARYSAKDATRQGVKIGGKIGQSILAAEAGRVVYSGSGLIGYGQLIIIKHNDNYLSAYGHNAKLLVKEGDQVARGRHIADMGRSNDGRPMLHFEIRREGRPIDPLALLPRR